MRKSLRLKGVAAAAVAIAFGLCLAAGCAPAGGASDGALADTGDLAAAYPVHGSNAEDGAGLAGYHAALGQDCASCHQGNLADQLAAAGIEGEPDCSSTFYNDTATCLSSDCHVSWDALAERTADLGDYNPHDSIHGTIEDCNECHKGHAEQVDICGQCHPNGGQEMTV
ncbi:cytochrome c3 family protein [Adlercreutzia sp. R21]|uniref:Cytochrome c3 family protein n=1 Tax=Adlercreutzia wanghongyangiae TaxID=3111451 RepID=A0ABU6II27_9ACTN|nr:cytochrome c3 family protein [Adlercreutzia sp. R21]MEC4176116.1 cytochrome c3 family protein [Adlercreutzia sp. R7]MEC4183964.1 cytochrome c3 family protein [Adlercreutzia sp. R21]